MITHEEWKNVNEHECNWWGNCTNTADEEAKQDDYAKYMGLDQYRIPGVLGLNLDLQGKSVLDIGGGPVSMLLKCRNKGYCVVLDPCKFPDWVMTRYKDAGINFINRMAEDIGNGWNEKIFDEIWIYNVLQHTCDPEKVLEVAKRYGKTIRIFEWIDTVSNEGHPHIQTKDWLDRQLGVWGKTVQLTWAGRSTPVAYYAVVAPDIDEKFRFHMLGLAHVPTNKEIAYSCAYSMKVEKLARMLKSLGHTVLFYGAENSKVECDEFVQCITKQQMIDCYGEYDLNREFFKHDGQDAAYTAFNKMAAEEINKRYQPRDFLLCPMGHYNKNLVLDIRGYFCREEFLNQRIGRLMCTD